MARAQRRMAAHNIGQTVGQVYSFIDQLESDDDSDLHVSDDELRRQAGVIATDLSVRNPGVTSSRELLDAIQSIENTLRSLTVRCALSVVSLACF